MRIFLETERLLLRRFTADDVENLFELDRDPAVMRFINGGKPTPRGVIQNEILPRFLRSYDQRLGYGYWAVVEKASGAFLGWFGFHPPDETRPDDVALGYRLRRSAWGKGYATEGARALIHQGFTELGARRVFATTYQDNLASRRVMEKAGLTLVRTFRLTPVELAAAGTFDVSSEELWPGEDVEYAIERAEWERQTKAWLDGGSVCRRQTDPPSSQAALQGGSMKILIDVPLTEVQLARIRDAAGDASVVVATDRAGMYREVRDADVVFGHFDADLFERGGQLRWVQTLGAGVDGVLFEDFANSEIVLTSEKGYVGAHLAEHSFALLLALTRGIARSVREQTWENRWSIRSQCWELTDRTMGIVGLGGTGREVARRAAAFGMRVLAVDPEAVARPPEVEAVWGMDGFYRLLNESDVVAIAAPLTPETRGMFDLNAFRQMKPTALLINVTRGAIVDDASLLRALDEKLIAGAGLDVTPIEPLPADHSLWRRENVVITPHAAGASPYRQDRVVDLFCRNLVALREGRPLESVIDKKKGY